MKVRSRRWLASAMCSSSLFVFIILILIPCVPPNHQQQRKHDVFTQFSGRLATISRLLRGWQWFCGVLLNNPCVQVGRSAVHPSSRCYRQFISTPEVLSAVLSCPRLKGWASAACLWFAIWLFVSCV